jgi:hypothetical protein
MYVKHRPVSTPGSVLLIQSVGQFVRTPGASFTFLKKLLIQPVISLELTGSKKGFEPIKAAHIWDAAEAVTARSSQPASSGKQLQGEYSLFDLLPFTKVFKSTLIHSLGRDLFFKEIRTKE